jgi:TolA-binding protein
VNRLIQLFFTLTFLISIFSCSTIETDEERLVEEDRNLNDQISQLAKQNKLIEEEIFDLKNQLSEIQKAIAEGNSSIIPNDSERQSYQESFELIRKGDYEAAEASFTNYIKTYEGSDFIDDAKFWLAQSMYSQEKYVY